MQGRKKILLSAVVTLFLLSVSCNVPVVSALFATPTPTVTPTPTKTPTPTRTPTRTPSPTPEPILGIDEPIVVRGVDLIFEDAELTKVFRFATRTHRAKAPYDTLFVAYAHTEHEETNIACDWKGDDQVNLQWSRNGKSESLDWGVCISHTDGGIEFIFASYEDGEDWVIGLPGGVEVPIDSLVE